MARKRQHKMSSEELEWWNRNIYRVFQMRRHTVDTVWRVGEKAVNANHRGTQIKGNIVSDFVGRLANKVQTAEAAIKIRTDDPTKSEHADRAEVVASAVSRIVGLNEVVSEATINACWGLGVVEIGHPLNVMNLDPLRSRFAFGPSQQMQAGAQDVYERLTPEDAARYGIDLESVSETVVPVSEKTDDPVPMFGSGLGYPWARSVDPRMIVMPLNTRKAQDAPWLVRLRFISRGELKKLTGVNVPRGSVNGTQFSDLFKEVDPEDNIHEYPEMLLVAELYIKRDRNNPKNNGQFVVYLFNDPKTVIFNGQNTVGGMNPYIIFRVEGMKKLYTNPIAIDLIPFSQLYDLSLRAIRENLLDQASRVLLIGRGAGMDDKDQDKLLDRTFRGKLQVNDPSEIQRFMGDAKTDRELMQTSMYLKSLARGRSNLIEADEGQSVKDVTARQTQAILDSVGMNIAAIERDVSDVYRIAVIKVMHLIGIFSTATGSLQFQYGGTMASFSPGVQDFVSSLIYDVKVDINGKVMSAEERMIYTQFVKLIMANPDFWTKVDHGYLLADGFDKFDISRRALLGAGQIGAMEAAGMASPSALSENPLQPGGQNVIDGVFGQHPERLAGSQGLKAGTGNLQRGGLKIGTQK